MTLKLVIRPFSILEFASQNYSITTIGATHYHRDPNVHAALEFLFGIERLPRQADEYISMLTEVIGNPKEVFSFLKSDYKIFQGIPAFPLIKNVCLISDDDEISSQLHTYITGIHNISVKVCSSVSKITSDQELFIAFFKNYSSSLISTLYRQLTDSDHLYLLSYIQRRALQIDNIHDNRATVPCHFCRQLNFESIDKDFRKIDEISISRHVRDLENLSKPIDLSLPITPIDRGLISFYLSQEIGRLVDASSPLPFHDHIIKQSTVDLDSGSISLAPASFHPGCECWTRS